MEERDAVERGFWARIRKERERVGKPTGNAQWRRRIGRSVPLSFSVVQAGRRVSGLMNRRIGQSTPLL